MRHRSARGRRRFHTERVISNRQRRYVRITPAWARSRRLEDGRLADADRYYDCGRARCGVCHWEKFYEPRRAREEREWRQLEVLAW
jgi:ferredoxin